LLYRLLGVRRCRARTRARTRPSSRCDHRRPPCDILQCTDCLRTVGLQRLQPADLQCILGVPPSRFAVRVQKLRLRRLIGTVGGGPGISEIKDQFPWTHHESINRSTPPQNLSQKSITDFPRGFTLFTHPSSFSPVRITPHSHKI